MVNNHKELSKEYRRLRENYTTKERDWVLAAKELSVELRRVHLSLIFYQCSIMPSESFVKYEAITKEQMKNALQDLDSFVMTLIAKAAE
jgi:hypothetical protein